MNHNLYIKTEGNIDVELTWEDLRKLALRRFNYMKRSYGHEQREEGQMEKDKMVTRNRLEVRRKEAS